MREVGTAGDNSGVSEGESLLSYREQGQLWNILGSSTVQKEMEKWRRDKRLGGAWSYITATCE